MRDRKTLRVWQWMPAVFFLFGMLSIFMLFATYLIGEQLRLNSAMTYALEGLVIRTTTAHLWFEQAIAGDPEVDIRNVWADLDRAENLIAALLNDGDTEHGNVLKPLKDPQQRAQVEEMKSLLANFRDLAVQRYQEPKGSWMNPPLNKRIDEVFKEFRDKATSLEIIFEEKQSLDRVRSRYLISGILIIWSFIVVGTTIGLRNRERRRRETEETLLESEKRYRTLFERAGDAIFLLEAEGENAGRIVTANQVAAEMHGYTVDELLDLNIQDLKNLEPAEAARAAQSRIRKMLAGEWIKTEITHRRKNGAAFPCEMSAGLLELGDHKYILAFDRDITQRKKTEEELKRHQERLEELVLDRTIELVTANALLQQEVSERKAIEEALRSRDKILEAVVLAAEQFLKMQPWEQSIQDVLALLGKTMGVSRVYVFENHIGNHGAQLTSQRYEWAASGITPQINNPELQDFAWSASGFERWAETLSKGHPLLGHVREFPEKEREVLAAQSIRSLVVVPIFVNEAWWGFIGFDECLNERNWSVAEIDALKVAAGTLGAVIQRGKAEEALRESESSFRNLYRQFRTILEAVTDPLTLISPDLKIIWRNRSSVSVTGKEISDPAGRYCYTLWHNRSTPCEGCPVVKSLHSGKEEISHIEGPGGKLWELRAFPVKDEEDKVSSFLTVASDITEKTNLEAEARRVAHLASLGELAAGVAHEINNPINGIINYAQILANKSKAGSRENDIANSIIKEGDRVANIVKSLLSFARAGRTEKNPARIHEILTDSLALTSVQIRKDGITLNVDIPPDLPEILAHPQQIQQVFLNIINNSRYALNQRYRGVHKDKVLKILAEEVSVGGEPYVRVTFYDQGSGIPSDIMDKVLNPFFTTKPGGKGTGLGLSISHGIIADHGGKLVIDSVEGEFTRLSIELPAVEKK